MFKKTVFALSTLLAIAGAQAAPAYITNGADASLSGATVLDFESTPNGTTFTSRQIGGITFSAAPGSLYVNADLGSSYGMSGNSLQTYTTPNPVLINFNGNVSAFGFNWGAADQPWKLEIFDAANALLGSFVVAAQTSSTGYAGFVGVNGGGAAIASAKLTHNSVYGYDWVGIDNFKFVQANNALPEPASLALVALGLMGAAVGSRRKKA